MNFKINIASSSSVILLTVHCCLSKGLKPSELFLLWECGSHMNKWVEHTSSLQPGTKSMFPSRTLGTFTSCAMSALWEETNLGLSFKGKCTILESNVQHFPSLLLSLMKKVCFVIVCPLHGEERWSGLVCVSSWTKTWVQSKLAGRVSPLSSEAFNRKSKETQQLCFVILSNTPKETYSLSLLIWTHMFQTVFALTTLWRSHSSSFQTDF